MREIKFVLNGFFEQTPSDLCNLTITLVQEIARYMKHIYRVDNFETVSEKLIQVIKALLEFANPAEFEKINLFLIEIKEIKMTTQYALQANKSINLETSFDSSKSYIIS